MLLYWVLLAAAAILVGAQSLHWGAVIAAIVAARGWLWWLNSLKKGSRI